MIVNKYYISDHINVYSDKINKEKIPYKNFLSSDKLYVVVSFDSCKEPGKWEKLLTFGSNNNIKYTFFISGVYFLPDDQKDKYLHPADMANKGASTLNFGGSMEDVEKRKRVVIKAHSLGHDIQNHLCGHFNGAQDWTESMWRTEFKQFEEFCSFLPEKTHHIRFPYLLHNENSLPILKEFNIYSATSVPQIDSKDHTSYYRVTRKGDDTNFEFLEFPIWYVRLIDASLFDYNIYAYGQERNVDENTSIDTLINVYLDEAQRCYETQSPLFISHHFWDYFKGRYMEAMMQALLIIMKKYPVEFISVSELHSMLK